MISSDFIPWWRVQFSKEEADYVAHAIFNEHLSLGPITEEFEKKLAEKLSVPYVVATTSGSAAILMALMAINVDSGDEVIIPNRTWIASAHAAMMLGAKVVLVDVEKNIPNIDINQIAEKITSRTKAIIPTALNGRAVDIKEINRLAKKHNLHVIEDAAQALFSCSEDKFMGTESELNCFSLSVAKLIPTGQGGFITTNNQYLYRELKKIRTHGVDNLLNCHFTRFGFNFRFTDVQSAIGLSQLNKLEQKIQSLRKIYRRYEAGLIKCSHVKLIPVRVEQGELPLYIEALCADRTELINFLDARKIQCKAFYPSLHRARYLNCNNEFSNANIFESQGLTLPSGPDQPLEKIDKVIGALHEYENQHELNNERIGSGSLESNLVIQK
jgi:dTDP-4-amino-4,6-dideoxygalactose transaminase